MELPWYIVPLLLFALPASSYVIEKGDTDLILNWTNTDTNKYSLDLKENNHILGSDHLLLFTLKNVSSTINWRFGPNMFFYKIEDGPSGEYQFYTDQYIDYETEITHSYQITIIVDFVAVVTVNIINYDDESPTLTSPVCSMKENTDYDETNTECICTLSDPDGWLNQTTFKIINSNPNAVEETEMEDHLFKFTFDKAIPDDIYNTTVYLTTLQQLDYEKKIFYSFVVQARDGAQHSTIPKENVTCIVDVIDLNTKPPEWTDYFTTMQIQEKTPYTFTVRAVDGNRGINAAIKYELVSFDEDVCAGSCVTIDTENSKGVLQVNPIDRDAKDLSTYKIQITAIVENEPPYSTPLDITFFVEDIDDNSPLFINISRSNDTTITFVEDPKVAEFTFFENFAGTIDGQILIQDIDTGVNAQFSVELQEDDYRSNKSVEYTEAFLIVPTAGYRKGIFQIPVKNVTYLDFENVPWQNFSFYVHSEGSLNALHEDDLLVKIHLLDYNDELPKFEKSSYTVAVNETIKKGEIIIKVKATDRDAEDAILRHELIGPDTIISLIAIDSAEGVITVAKVNAFDYDRINPVIFQVQAIDKVGHTTTVSVVVNLLDINNKAPTYKVEEVIRVDENQVIGIELNATITASDVDTTRNLTAEIDWEKSYVMKNSQRLNSSNPDIRKAMQFINITFDKISVDSIEIKLIVNDNNDNQTAPDYETFDTLYLDITITDLNTELPEFIDQMSIDALIVVNINDINDNAPIFTNETLGKNRTIYEKSPNGTIVGTIVAVDADVGDVVSYSCIYLDKDFDWFYCDEYGQISAKTKNIDADTDKVFYVEINCSATDGFWITPQNFSIYILDTNDQWPVIKINDSLNTQVVEIYEKSDPDTIVTVIGYDDADRDIPFHTVECRLNRSEECFDSFKIENNLLKVSIGGDDLDRDTKKASYSCTPTCYDNPNFEQNYGQNQNTTTTFTIKLLDINDHCPEMISAPSEGSENLMKGDTIGIVVAEDLDEGDNAEIEMSVLTVTRAADGEDITSQDLFAMKKDDDYYLNLTKKRWHLVANQDLRDHYGEYILQLKLNDLGSPPQSTEDVNNTEYKEKAKFSLIINKFNYYSPIFVFPTASKLSFSLSSEQEPGSPLVMYYKNESFSNIEITDGEEEQCIDKWDPEFDVTLVDVEVSAVKNFFTIKKLTRCTAQLQVDDSYDKSDAIDYTYQLQLTSTLDTVTASKGEAEYTTSINLKINFVDVNDDPIFDTSLGPWNISLQEADVSQSEPLPEERKAFYANVDDSDDITKFYFLKSDDKTVEETFTINVNSGAVELKKELDYLEKKSYQFEIQASRNQSGLSTKSASRMTVYVNVLEINRHVPQWTQETFFGAVMKSTQIASTVVTIEATDLDEIDKGKLTYHRNSTFQVTGSENLNNIAEPFLLDEITGVITLNFQVDYNMNGWFFFLVLVKDVQDEYGYGPFENITSVTIHIVTDNNTVTFKFENTLDTVVSKRSEVLQIISNGLGWDCRDQNIAKNSENGITYDNVTSAKIYCVEDNSLLTSDDIKTKLNNINTFQQLKQDLLEIGILLENFNADALSIDNLENTLKVALIAVSVVLGALCIILGVTFFLKARELNRRLNKLTQPKFGSDESNINRQGINVPTTNIFAVEGSNPVFNSDMIKEDLDKEDTFSIRSNNSELIGVEDNPEFDDMFGEVRFKDT